MRHSLKWYLSNPATVWGSSTCIRSIGCPGEGRAPICIAASVVCVCVWVCGGGGGGGGGSLDCSTACLGLI